jgi:hypothetical protein
MVPVKTKPFLKNISHQLLLSHTMDIDHSTTCDVTPAAEEGHNNPLTPQRIPFRCLTPIGANASPTLSEGFIREYLSPGTIYAPGVRYSNTPITRENSPALAAVSAGVGSSLCKYPYIF